MDQKDLRDQRDQKVQKVLMDLREQLDHLAHKDHGETRVQQENKELQASLDHKGLLVLKDQLGQLDQEVLRDPKDPKESKVTQVFREKGEILVQPAHRVHKGLLALKVHKDLMETKAQRAQMVQLD